MKRLSLIGLCVFVIFMQGCLSRAMIDEQLALCPEFVQNNVGEIKYMPISWGTAMGISGVTDKKTGEIWLTAWAGEHTLMHEIGHSVYFRAEDAEQFYSDFSQMSKPKSQNNLVLFAVPMAGYLPYKDFRNLYSSTNIYEDMAECFVAGMRGEKGSEAFNKKVDRVMEFYIKGKWNGKTMNGLISHRKNSEGNSRKIPKK